MFFSKETLVSQYRREGQTTICIKGSTKLIKKLACSFGPTKKNCAKAIKEALMGWPLLEQTTYICI